MLTRLYGAGDFGTLGLFTSYLSVTLAAVGLQFEVGIVSGKDEAEAAYLMFAALFAALPMSLLSGVVLWLMIRMRVLGFGALPEYMPLLLIAAMCFAGAFTALRYWCVRGGEFRHISQSTVAQSAGRAACQVLLGTCGLHSGGLVFGETLGRCLGMSRMMRNAWPALRRRLRAFSWHEFREALWRNRQFPFFSLPSTLLDALCLGLSVPLLIHLYGADVGGCFSLVWKTVALPSVLITVAVADTYHARLASCARETPRESMKLFRRTSLGLLCLGSLPAGILWLWGPPLFRFAFGAQWWQAGVFASAVAPWYLAQFVVSPLSRAVAIFRGQETKLLWDVLCLISLLLVFITAHRARLEALQTIRLLAFVNVDLLAVYYLLLLRIVGGFMRTIDLEPTAGALASVEG
jgi:O-antigen/teichoic acid export membrane protein